MSTPQFELFYQADSPCCGPVRQPCLFCRSYHSLLHASLSPLHAVLLFTVKRLVIDQVVGNDGSLFVCNQNGKILKIEIDGQAVECAETGGIPR